MSSQHGLRPGATYGDLKWKEFPVVTLKGVWNYFEYPCGHFHYRGRDNGAIVNVTRWPFKDQQFLWSSEGTNSLFVREDLVDEFSRFSGFRFVNPEIVNCPVKYSDLKFNFLELKIVSKAILDYAASGIEQLQSPCPVCGRREFTKDTDGLVLSSDSARDDFMLADEYKLIPIISDAVFDFIVSRGLKVCTAYRLIDRPFDSSATFEQQRLNDLHRLVRQGYSVEEAEKMVVSPEFLKRLRATLEYQARLNNILKDQGE